MILRAWYVDWIIGWVALCLCFSHLEKLSLNASSTPPRYLLDTLLSVKLLQLFLIVIPTASRSLVDRSSFYSWFCWICSSTPPRYLSYWQSFSRHLPRQVSRYLLTPASVKIYCRHYISSLCDLVLISIDLSLNTSLFSLPKHSHLTPNFVLQGFFKLFQGFFKLFQEFLPLVSFQSSHIHAFHVLKPRFWGFWKILGFFKIDELLLNFGMGFHLNEFKTSYIASH